MSNHLAIATVTATLRQVIEDEVTDLLPGVEVTVSHVRPGGETPVTPDTGVNVFLYGVSPNPQWRNADLPTRRTDGNLAQRAVAALDLHYLISFYGDDTTLETQRLLGGVVRALHARPALGRDKLREVVTSNDAFLAGSDIPDAVELVRFTPVPLSLEELSKLWSVLFQTTYALSVVYQGSVVLVEDEATPRAGLPAKARQLYVVPFRELRIEDVSPEDGPRRPILAGSTLTVRGRGLKGDVTRVRIGREIVEPSMVSERELVVPLSAVPAGELRAGVQGVQVVHQRLMGMPRTPHLGDESNVAAIVLRPSIDRVPPDPLDPEAIEHEVHFLPAADPDPPRVEVELTPPVGERQRAVLLLDRVDPDPPLSYALAAPARDADTSVLAFDVSDVASGTYLVRVRVDGAESLLLPDGPGAFTDPRVVIP